MVVVGSFVGGGAVGGWVDGGAGMGRGYSLSLVHPCPVYFHA